MKGPIKGPKPFGTLDRRRFFSTVVAAGAAATLPVPKVADAAEPGGAAAKDTKPAAPVSGTAPPSAAQLARDVGRPAEKEASATVGCGSDFMVDVMRSVGIDYVFATPGSSFLGLHESIVNYGANRAPELITCLHEESSVAMAHGYYKAAGKPAAAACHSNVGLQHAAMALYNAWCDRVPVMAVAGNTLDLTKRTFEIEWLHSAQDLAAMVRDFVKWDDQPTTLQGFAESFIRAYKVGCTPPMEPTVIVLDEALQEMPLAGRGELTVPRYSPSVPPQGEEHAVREAGRMLAEAERPVILVDRLARTAEGMRLLVELAETVNAPVVDLGSRQNMPTMHPLCQSGAGAQLVAQADFILGLEVRDFWGQVNQFNRFAKTSSPRIRPGTKLVTIGVDNLYLKSNNQDFMRYAEVDLSISGDGEATLPSLIDAVNSALTGARKSALQSRLDVFRGRHAAAFEAARQAAAYGWDASPVSTARLCTELWEAIKGEDWALVSVGASEWMMSFWPHRLWNFDRHYRFLGNAGGGGVGYGLPAAVGAALANKALGRLSVNIQCDGDFMFANGALWTAAHHHVPLLTVMHNNRAYGQETMLLQELANQRNRGVHNARVGTGIDNPPINYAKLADSMGVWSAGPISDPAQLAPALKRAVEVVKQGQPALVDVVTQTR